MNNKAKVQKLWGLIEYKLHWGITGKGWIVMLLTVTIIILFTLAYIQPFLSSSSPIQADALVVEGWIADEAIKKAMVKFQQGNYKVLITTGSPLSKGYYLAQYKTFAELTAATFISLGFDPDKLVAIPSPKVKIDRTAAAAITLRKWLYTNDMLIKSINLYSFDVHTRRSWLIFKTILTPDIKVGAISYPSPDYNPQYWWTSSEGFRMVISETIAYLYARFIWRIKPTYSANIPLTKILEVQPIIKNK